MYGSEAGPVERMLDIRVNTALELLPKQVSAVWFESEWVLAQLDSDAGFLTPPTANQPSPSGTMPTW